MKTDLLCDLFSERVSDAIKELPQNVDLIVLQMAMQKETSPMKVALLVDLLLMILPDELFYDLIDRHVKPVEPKTAIEELREEVAIEYRKKRGSIH